MNMDASSQKHIYTFHLLFAPMEVDTFFKCDEDASWLQSSSLTSTYSLDMAVLLAHAKHSVSPELTLALDLQTPCFPAGKYDMREALRTFLDDISEMGVLVGCEGYGNLEAKMQTTGLNHHLDIRFDCADYITAYDVIDRIQRQTVSEDYWFQVSVQEVWQCAAPEKFTVVYSLCDEWPRHTLGTPSDILARLCDNFAQKQQYGADMPGSEEMFWDDE
jgi:hypothetical protein